MHLLSEEKKADYPIVGSSKLNSEEGHGKIQRRVSGEGTTIESVDRELFTTSPEYVLLHAVGSFSSGVCCSGHPDNGLAISCTTEEPSDRQ